jgi:hypothetical protein
MYSTMNVNFTPFVLGVVPQNVRLPTLAWNLCGGHCWSDETTRT